MNKKIKKMICVLTVGLLCIPVNAAGALSGEKKSESLSLRFFLNQSEKEAVYDPLLKEYEDRTGITLIPDPEEPDVYVGTMEEMTEDFKEGRLHNFLYLYDRENPYDGGEVWGEGLLGYTADEMHITDKEVPGYPASTTVVRLLCNERLFEEAGAELPSDWEELLAACEAFEGTGTAPFAFANASCEEPMWQWLLNALSNQAAAELSGTLDVNEKDKGYVELEEFCKGVDKGALNVGETAAVQAYLRIRELSGYFAEGSAAMSGKEAVKMVGEGRAAMTLGTHRDVAEAKELLAIPIPLPEQKEDGSGSGMADGTAVGVFCGGEPEVVYGISTAVSKESDEFEAAVDFIQYMTGAQVQEQLAQKLGIFPSNQRAALPEYMSGFAVDEKKESPVKNPFWTGVSQTHREAVWQLLMEYLSGECTDEELGEKLTTSFRNGVKEVVEEKGWNLINNYGMPTAGECTMCEP